MSGGVRRVTVAAVALVVLGLGGVHAHEPSPTPPTSVPAGCLRATRSITMYAEELPRTPEGEARLGWGLTPGGATIPGPTLEMVEGECLQITVVNNVPAATLEELRAAYPVRPGSHATPLGVSLHVHGVKYTQSSDGTAHSGSWVPPGQSRTYTWYAAPRAAVPGQPVAQGTAGTWWYHDHVVGTAHGTGGQQAGLFGALVVRRPGDPRPDRHFTVVMGPRQTINLAHNPAPFVAREGERVEFSVLNVGDEFHTFHLHGHVWADNRTGVFDDASDSTRLIDAKTIGPSESFGFQVTAGESVGTGAWMLHCHVQAHSDRGMATYFQVDTR